MHSNLSQSQLPGEHCILNKDMDYIGVCHLCTFSEPMKVPGTSWISVNVCGMSEGIMVVVSLVISVLCSNLSPFFKGKYKFYTRICWISIQGLIFFLFIPLSLHVPSPFSAPPPLSKIPALESLPSNHP